MKTQKTFSLSRIFEKVRYNDYDRAPLDYLSNEDIDSFYAHHQKLSAIIRYVGKSGKFLVRWRAKGIDRTVLAQRLSTNMYATLIDVFFSHEIAMKICLCCLMEGKQLNFVAFATPVGLLT